jgi:hypothetical protein
MIKIGKQSEETSFKLYKGVAALNIIAVNPTKSEMEKITGRTMDNEPEYVGKDDNGNDFVRLTFWAKTAADAKVNNGIDMTTSFSFILTKKQRVGANSGKIQIIDKYGRTAWATKEDIASKSIPQYSSGPANIDKDYRPACDGEEFLVDFLINWLNIPGPAAYKDGKWVMKEDPSDSEVSLNLGDLFKGNVKEIAELIKLAANYAVKAAVGIRTTDEGKQYQQVFTRKFVKNGVTDYSKLDAVIAEFKSNGGAPNTDYDCTPLHENVVEETKFKENTSSEMPFDAPSSSPWD